MKIITTALSCISLLAAAPLSAQTVTPGSDLSSDQLTAGVRYLMPQLLEIIQGKCAPSLETDGYLATNGDTLLERFSDGADENWPEARDVFLSLAMKGGSQGEEFDALAELPDEALRPIFDAMFPLELSKKLNTRDCASIERVLETLDPLPADNLAQFIGVVFELALKDSGKKDRNRVAAE